MFLKQTVSIRSELLHSIIAILYIIHFVCLKMHMRLCEFPRSYLAQGVEVLTFSFPLSLSLSLFTKKNWLFIKGRLFILFFFILHLYNYTLFLGKIILHRCILNCLVAFSFCMFTILSFFFFCLNVTPSIYFTNCFKYIYLNNKKELK